MKHLILLLFSIVAVSSANAELVAWYPFDEVPASPDIVHEIAGDAQNAFTIGFAPEEPDFNFLTRGHPSARPNLGTSYSLAKGGGIELGNEPVVQPTDKFTISFWTQPETLDAFDRFLESQSGNGNDQDGIRIDMGSGNAMRVLVRDANGATNTQFNHPTTLKNDGTWYFVAFRYDSEAAESGFQLTLIEHTGEAVDESTIAAATGGPATLNTGPLHYPHANDTLIGVENAGGTGNNSLNAALDELAFYDNSDGNGVLTDAQLADVYNFGPSGVEVINAFATDAASVAPGSAATLSWTVLENVDTLVLEDGLGNVTDLAPMTTNGTGTFAVNPDETTAYTLRATQGTATNAYTIRILSGAAPDIDSFNGSTELIKAGESLDLSWLVTGADTLTLGPGDADVTGTTEISAAPTETTTYVLSATNGFGTSTAEVIVTVITGPVPVHGYDASRPDNDDLTWFDGVGDKNLALNGAAPGELFDPSENTNITAAYTTGGGLAGGTVGSFQFPEFTAEIWLRPGEDLTTDHEVIFESGGGQNGFAILMNNGGFRFIGSAGDTRNLDINVSLSGLVLTDFLQLVFSTNANTDAIEVSIRDTFGNTKTASETADVIIGGNGAVLFAYGSGGLGGDTNLGGRTEEENVNPEGLTGFAGEIAIMNIYDRILESSDIDEAFARVATSVGTPPAPFEVSQIVRGENSLIVSWDSDSGANYGAQFSTDLEEWFDLAGPFPGTGDPITETLNVPPNRPLFFIRIGRQ